MIIIILPIIIVIILLFSFANDNISSGSKTTVN